MNLKWQSLIFLIVLFLSITIVQFSFGNSSNSSQAKSKPNNQSTSTKKVEKKDNNLLAFEQAALQNYEGMEKVPTRKWNVLDPEISAHSAIVNSLNSNTPLFYKSVHEPQTLASLTKLITAVIVKEEIGLNKKVPISKDIIETRGIAGQLKSGEVYTSKNLLQIMLMVSSNDAANAFVEHIGGKEKFIEIAKQKMKKIGMDSTKIYDGSGLSDSNEGTAEDFLQLTKYILKNHPKILQWSRQSSILSQPINNEKTKRITNINPLVENKNFLGGKTGTSKAAGENLLAIFKLKDRKVLIILMNSDNRQSEAEKLINWINKAYQF